MDFSLSAIILLTSATLVLGQRPFFAGSKPIGFPDIPTKDDGLGNRFGEVDGTTPKLPIEANGDIDFLNRLDKLPVDQQPFWFINWQAYEAQRKNPQTYPQRPNSFIDPIPNGNSGVANPNFVTSNPNSPTSNSNSVTPNPNSVTPNPNAALTSNSDSTANRFGDADSNANVKPVVLSASGVKPEVIKTKPEEKRGEPVEVKAPSNDNKKVEKPKVESTATNTDSTKPNSEGTKLEDVAPLVPSPIEPEPTVADGLKLKEDSSDGKKYRTLRSL